jgi:hypothetical protein
MNTDYNLVLERGKDGRLHLSKIEFFGLSGDECKDKMAEIVARLKSKGVMIDVKEYIPHPPHQEVREKRREKEVIGL